MDQRADRARVPHPAVFVFVFVFVPVMVAALVNRNDAVFVIHTLIDQQC